MRRIREIFFGLIALFALPAFGFVWGNYLRAHRFPVSFFFMIHVEGRKAGAVLRDMSIMSGVLAPALILLLWLGAVVCRDNRELLARVFGPLVRLVCLGIAILVILQTAIAVLGGALLTLGTLHVLPLGILLAVTVGAIYGAEEVARAALGMTRPVEQEVAARAVVKTSQARLWQVLAQVADRLGARMPDNVVVGLTPGFFVTGAPVRLQESRRVLTGETLYLSVPCLHLMNDRELVAVLGHEFSHFVGADTAFSLRFLPVYGSLFHALAGAYASGGLRGMGLASARAILSLGVFWFARVERRIGRLREIEADKAGALLADPSSVVAVIARLSALDGLWSAVLRGTVSDIGEGRLDKNLSSTFVSAAHSRFNETETTALLQQVAKLRMAHPTDTHPTLSERAAALGVRLEDTAIIPDANVAVASALLDDVGELERLLSEDCRTLLIRSGLARPPRDPSRPNFVQKKQLQRRAQSEARKRRLEAAGASPAETQ